MMASATFLSVATVIALGLLCLSLLITGWRVLIGPSLADRVLALDMMVAIAIGFIAVIAIRSGQTLYVDIAISLGLVGFLSTVAFARYILARGQADRKGGAGKPARKAQRKGAGR